MTLNQLSYGMYVIATKIEERNIGCFVNTVTQVTSENPMISVCINKKNYTNEIIKETRKFSISILSTETDPRIIGKFGFFSSRDIDKFEDVAYEEMSGIPVLKEKICGAVLCEVVEIVDAETHEIFLARVIDTKKSEENLEPMTYRYYHEVIKGKAPKTAPTYIEEKIEKQENNVSNKRYQCSTCGYIYDDSKEEVRFEDLPEDWKCPRCGVGKSLFQEI